MSVAYHLWLDEAAKGPFTIGQLRSMWNSGQITAETHYTADAGESWHSLSEIISDLEPEAAPVVKEEHDVECPHCGKTEVVNIGTGPYECEHCGKDFEITLACPKCGEDMEVEKWGEAKCPACGTSFNSWKEAEVSSDNELPQIVPRIETSESQPALAKVANKREDSSSYQKRLAEFINKGWTVISEGPTGAQLQGPKEMAPVTKGCLARSWCSSVTFLWKRPNIDYRRSYRSRKSET